MNPNVAWIAQNQSSPQGLKSSVVFFALMMAMVVFLILTSRSQKKRERRERENMYARLSKNDRVLTIGGAIGTIVSVKDEQVVVKVDESTNTKMTFMKSAIQKIMSDDSPLSGEKS